MMKMFCRIPIVLLILIPLVGCSKERATYEGSENALQLEQSKQAEGADKQVKEDRKLIKEGEVRFESYDLGKTREDVDKAIVEFGAYIAKENRYTQSDRIQQSIIIRVPAGSFDAMVERITSQAGRLDSKNIELKDVTEEYYDTELRIRIKKETEKRYRELLARANTIDEILSIERQLGNIRAEIESLEGRFKYLNNKIAYGTLTVNFYQVVSATIGFKTKFRHGIENGWNNFVWFLVGLVNIWPFIVIVLIAIPAVRLIRKSKKRSNRSSKKEEA